MQTDFKEMPTSNFTSLSRKSWTAYVKAVVLGGVLAVLLAFVISVLYFGMRDGKSPEFGAILWGAWISLLLVLALTVYQVLVLRSYRLYYDDTGVWLYKGILPWNKGRLGVMWRDLDTAEFTPGFLSWLFKSYRIRVGHRFTRSSEVILTSMVRGDQAVATINTIHQDLARNNRLS